MLFEVAVGQCEGAVVLLVVAVQSQATHLTEGHHLLVSKPRLLLLPPPLLLLVLGLPQLVLCPGRSEEVVTPFQMHVTCGVILANHKQRIITIILLHKIIDPSVPSEIV